MYCDPLKFVFSETNCILIVQKNIIELQGRDLAINAEVLDHVSKSKKRNHRHIQRSHAMRAQIFAIPRFELSLVHYKKNVAAQKTPFANRLRKEGYSHHDVYLYPSSGSDVM